MNEQITSAAELDALTDLVVRLNRANKGLLSQSRTNITSERTRLEGKAEGVRLALSYVEEAIRARPDQPQRVQPSREDVARRILDKTVGVVDCELHERLMTPMWDRATSAADAALALFVQHPTVAEVKADALREAADDYTYSYGGQGATKARPAARKWLRDRADRIEREARP